MTKEKLKLTTFKGVRGYWITTRYGRKVFIPEERFKGYKNWRRATTATILAAAGGILTATTSRVFSYCVPDVGV